MPIELWTGLPGNGKTAFMVEQLLDDAKKGERPLYASGIDGLVEGVATNLDDPKLWNKEDPDGEPTCDCHQDGRLHAHFVPDGAKIYVDEAWKNFGHLHEASRGANPAHVLALAEHRHRGIDFVWTTQQPNQIYPFARSLIARHTHVVRRFGTHFCDLYTWEELNEETKSAGKRDNATKQVRRLPNQVFDKYKSATLHTIKRRLPLKLIALPLLILVAITLFYLTWRYYNPTAMTARLQARSGAASGAAGSAPPGTASRAASGPATELLTPDEVHKRRAIYIQQQQPLLVNAPWSAPLYADRGITVDPTAFCMASGEAPEQSCRCLTEQGTRYPMALDACIDMARNGPAYNPFKGEAKDEPREAKRDQGEKRTAPQTAASIASGAGTVKQDPAYGGIGIGPDRT